MEPVFMSNDILSKMFDRFVPGKPGTLSGSVVDYGGKAAAGIFVFAGDRWTKTADSGKFVFVGLEAGALQLGLLYLKDGHYFPNVDQVIVQAGKNVDVKLNLPRSEQQLLPPAASITSIPKILPQNVPEIEKDVDVWLNGSIIFLHDSNGTGRIASSKDRSAIVEEFWFSKRNLFDTTTNLSTGMSVIFRPQPTPPTKTNRVADCIFIEGNTYKGKLTQKFERSALADVHGSNGKQHMMFLETGLNMPFSVGQIVGFEVKGYNFKGPKGKNLRDLHAIMGGECETIPS